MATTAKLKTEGNYEIFQDGQRVATGTPSILSQYGLSETNLTNEATTPSGQKVNPITGQIINGDVLKDTPPLNFATPDFTPPSDISGLQPAEIKMTPQEEKQTSLEKRMAELQLSLAGKPSFEAEKRTEFGVLNAQQAYDDLNTQLRDLQRQQQLVPLDIQRQSEGRGRTEGGVEPLEIGKRRALAYDTLTTSSLIDAAQGRLASAERKVIEAVNQKFAPDEAMYATLLKNLNILKNSPETTVQEMNRANQQEAIFKAQQEATAKIKEQAKNIVNWANKAAENMAKQGTLDPVMLNKIKNSKTESEAFALAAPFLAVKDKLTGQSDFEQAFLRDTGRLPSVAELQAYKTSQEKPTFQTFERVGADGKIHNIRQVIDSQGKVILETDLGAKEKPTGLTTSTEKVLEGEFGDVIKSASNLVGAEKGKTSKVSIAQAIADNDFTSAYAQIANNVEESLTGEVKTKFANSRIDYNVMTGMKKAIQDFSDADGNMGYLKGTADEIARRFGQLTTDPKFAALAVQLQREFQTYRLNMTGAAFSPAESKEYAAVNPRTTASLDLNLATIDGALNQLENRITSTVNSKIPNAKKLYQKIGGDGMSDDDAYTEYLKLTGQSSGSR